MAKGGWQSVLAAAANGCAGEDGCCQCVEPGEPCCMTSGARRVFELIEGAGGPSLEQCEAIAEGKMCVVSADLLPKVLNNASAHAQALEDLHEFAEADNLRNSAV